MVNIKVLVVVLCSCFIQDALSAISSQANAKVPKRQKTVAPQPNQLSRTSSKKRETIVEQPLPPSKYPALAKLEHMFWDTAENINKANEYGKLDVRAARNAMAGVLTNPAFWTAVNMLASKVTKITNDTRRANFQIRLSNAFTDTMTKPLAVKGYEQMVDKVYDSVADLNSTPFVDAFQEIIDGVEDGTVTQMLDEASNFVKDIQFDPLLVTRGFNLIWKTINKSTLLSMGNGMSDNITKISTMLNKNK